MTYATLPNANFDPAGGLVNGITVPANNSVSNQDVVYVTNTNYGIRPSKDWLVSFMGNYAGDDFRLQTGLFAVQADQKIDTWFNGRGLSTFENGNISNLGARFITANGTYQLSDEAGWGREGGGYADGGFTGFSYRSRQRDVQPLLGAS